MAFTAGQIFETKTGEVEKCWKTRLLS